MSRGRPSTHPLRGITRFDYDKWGQELWWVRFQRGTTLTSKTFPDSKWGGKRKALKAAQLWRNRTERELETPIVQPNTEKPPGYGYVKKSTVQQKVSQSDVWIAWLRIHGRRCKATKFSIERWGNAEAKRLAEQWLIDKRKELGLTDPDAHIRKRPVTPPRPSMPHATAKKRSKKRAKNKTKKKKRVSR